MFVFGMFAFNMDLSYTSVVKFFFTLTLQCPPLKGRVQKILFWKWIDPEPVEDEMDHVTPHSPSKKEV